jgi:hypothetical protein
MIALPLLLSVALVLGLYYALTLIPERPVPPGTNVGE